MYAPSGCVTIRPLGAKFAGALTFGSCRFGVFAALACFTSRLLPVVRDAEGGKVGPFPFVSSLADWRDVVDLFGEAVAVGVLAEGLAAEFGCADCHPSAATGLPVATRRGCWHACTA